ncbi:hypothetical protein A8F94_08160 [Bacillus sp. FJAT-27225]|uniref:GNAT family N-acetyltransferase n=1 Tax=Bacillus sp. FJAT-27225 TaxID=1743144 RepID=UPI00080C2A28|nr:GNAT family N-acetyltransferase [Bacillus sp. FJAT-27225]OCA87807.1 hypothetical protein A8F94_08160 [Bacillus sp. FJAT-27225]
MIDIKYRIINENDVSQIATLLNNYLSFGNANERNLIKLCNSRYTLCAEINQKVIGYISSKEVINIEEDLNYNRKFIDAFNMARMNSKKEAIYITHMVVDPIFRKKGIGNKLLKFILREGHDKQFVAVGWVTPNGWNAKTIFLDNGFEIISKEERFWYSTENVITAYCPYCGEVCTCSAVLSFKG